jgi:hypothetical protein
MMKRFFLIVVLLLLVVSGGCATKGTLTPESSAGQQVAEDQPAQPYKANDFDDILIPSELTWDRENSMSIRTESFAGGTLKYTGRVEINSLADYFISSMQRNGWKLVGSVKYKNVLLAFSKPNKTCTISMFESEFSGRVSTYIYVTDDISARQQFSSPFGADTLR